MSTSPVVGFSHVQLQVRDLALSERWYTTVLGLVRLQADETAGFVALRHRGSGVVIVLTLRSDGDELRETVLDHLAFAVPGGEELEAWAGHLRAAGIDHQGVVLELGKPSLQLVDPDGIAIELVAPPRRDPSSDT